VTTTGGSGFQNSAIHSTIRSDLIQSDADALAATLNVQAIPVWTNERFGADAAENAPRVSWDVTPPKDLNAEATAMNQAAIAAKAMNEVLAPYGKRVDLDELARRYGVPVVDLEAAAMASPELSVVPDLKEAA
jgi:Fe2+ transport system protein B